MTVSTGLVTRLKDTLDNPFLFNILQFAIAGRQNITRRLIRDGLQLEPGERLLDVCCGTGEFANVALGPYLGIDINPKYIEYAAGKYGAGGGHPEREFVAEDITGTGFKNRGLTFPKAMLINSMHHLSDEQNQALLAAIASVTTDRFVVIDMDPTPSNPVSRFLAGQDRGEYIRPLKEQIALVEPYFKVEQAYTYYSGLCGQTILVCSKKDNR
ncbi:MAG TPA: methyltransferase domain-containing protein [Chloroflexia bacterium]|nr:methyltransferase domain-containing protein [Chloroflexia bacterium]